LKIVSTLFALVLAVSLVLLPAAVWAQDPTPYGGLAKCEWDRVVRETNPDSWHLYLQHWGRTPIQAMSRLSGLCGPNTLCEDAFGTNCPTDAGAPTNSCLSGCPACRDVEQGAVATCSDAAACTLSFGDTTSTLSTPASCVVTGQTPSACPDTPVIATELPHCCCCWGVSLAFASKSWAAADMTSSSKSLDNTHPNHLGSTPKTDGGLCSPNGGTGGDWGISGCPHNECCALTWCLQDNCLKTGKCN
jgi:hypothetical protein